MRETADAAAGKVRPVIGVALDELQRAAVEAPLDACIAIAGASGTGKTTASIERAARARACHLECDPLVLGRPEALAAVAVRVLDEAGQGVTLVDDAEALSLFESVCTPLFDLEWDEFAPHARSLDPEVPGLRSPHRFLEAAFRLIRKLRCATIAPEEFLATSLRSGAEFYAKPPNFADTGLLAATKEAYRDSLDVDRDELLRQYRREVDLTKILARLYERYVAFVDSTGKMTARDAIVRASDVLAADPGLSRALRRHYGFAFLDEAHDATPADVRLLQAIFGQDLAGVTLVGDPDSAFSAFGGARAAQTFALAAQRFDLREPHRPPPALRTHRAATVEDEAAFLAVHVADAIAGGTPPEEIAVILRSVADASAYEAALLDRGVAVASSGDVNPFADRRALDALALLWNAHDPFRHDWMLRTLGDDALGLSDASLAMLCSEPANPQRPLFALDAESAPTVRPSRWDPKRDLRLGWNVVRGDQDEALSPTAAERVKRFRAQLGTWRQAMHALPFDDFARLAWSQGLAAEGAPGSARARAQELVLERLLARLVLFLDEHSDAVASDALEYAERRAVSDLESVESARREGFANLLSVEAARGRSFEAVVIADARAGGFPRWYAPDAFLYSPRYGMVPKENAGDARASRTAKFSYYVRKAKVVEAYNAQERRAFEYAVRRARRTALVTASGSATRGITAPEFLEELRR